MKPRFRHKSLFVIFALIFILFLGCKASDSSVLPSLTLDGRKGAEPLPQDPAVLDKIRELNFVSWEIGRAEQELVRQCPNLQFLSLQSTRLSGISTFHVPDSVLSFRLHASRDGDAKVQLTGGECVASCYLYRVEIANLDLSAFANSKQLTELWICDSKIGSNLSQWLWSQESVVSLYFRGNDYPVGVFSHWELQSLVTADFRATSMTPEIESFLRRQRKLQSARSSQKIETRSDDDD